MTQIDGINPYLSFIIFYFCIWGRGGSLIITTVRVVSHRSQETAHLQEFDISRPREEFWWKVNCTTQIASALVIQRRPHLTKEYFSGHVRVSLILHIFSPNHVSRWWGCPEMLRICLNDFRFRPLIWWLAIHWLRYLAQLVRESIVGFTLTALLIWLRVFGHRAATEA